ncbi:acetyl-CoA C-acetyltransferase [Fontimonas thermophila]|uniref:Acetyl-CoA C-acetyltransferase n=1 Tax=Fontimonas thermophila TaxID=1076937 RepID=A0A1I2J9X1_9GAMM|nr:acetyl-CoA C-acyltransferase [Fontimonas thermophila]SFF50868.1 acetyl-CoA C-acetyltransferase [Fontimonas thermophila]
MTPPDPIVITGIARTPMGGMLGVLAPLSGAELGAVAIKAAVERSGLAADAVDEVIMGCCLPAGQGQAPARQAARKAGLSDATGALTINKMCGSGMKAIMLAHDLLRAGTARVMVAGGMESMTNAPYLLPKARGGYRYGHGEILDHMALDGLEDAYEKRTPMGLFAERTAERYGFSRAQQDAFAVASLTRAQRANEDGSFAFEMAAVEVPGKSGSERIERDEQPFKARIDKIPALKPAFKKDGTITAANASSISDGAAAAVLMPLSEAQRRGIAPLARIVAHASHSRLPAEFTIAPVNAIASVLEKAGWSAAQVDAWEINEAFAVVTMAAMQEHRLPHEKVNVHGGACALGHPIGASGARIVATLIGVLKKTGGRRGVATLCIGGGEAVALALEMY